MVEIVIPVPLQRFCDGEPTVLSNAPSVSAALTDLVKRYEHLSPYIYDEQKNLRPFVNLFLDGEDIRMLDGLDTALVPDARLEILPAIAGGSSRSRDWRDTIHPKVRDVSLDQAVNCEAHTLVVDVRTHDEWQRGHIPGAVHIDRGFLEMQIGKEVGDLARPIICYCQSGSRSQLAASSLITMGFDNVSSLAGGIESWNAAGNEIVVPDRPLFDEKRYARHLTIDKIGVSGQQKLAKSRVAIIGMGGLGCPVSLYLSAAGVGTLAFVDNDCVDMSNLQRQILFTPDMVGRPKTLCAENALSRFNPETELIPIERRLDEQGAMALFRDYDIIVDCTDNFTSRYLINDAAVALSKPLVYGAVYRFDAQVSVFGYDNGPCYRCFLPEPPPPELAPSCAEAGVLGVLPGTAGLLMATEVIKLLTGAGEVLSGRMTCYEALSGQFREVRFSKSPHCPQCADPAASFVANSEGANAQISV